MLAMCIKSQCQTTPFAPLELLLLFAAVVAALRCVALLCSACCRSGQILGVDHHMRQHPEDLLCALSSKPVLSTHTGFFCMQTAEAHNSTTTNAETESQQQTRKIAKQTHNRA